MNLHVEKVYNALRLFSQNKWSMPDYYLYIGPKNIERPSKIDGKPVIITPSYLGAIESYHIWYLPCYINGGHDDEYEAYISAYEDYKPNSQKQQDG